MEGTTRNFVARNARRFRLPRFSSGNTNFMAHSIASGAGFSFIEMALVVLAFGLLFVAGTKMYRIWERAHQSYETSVTLAQAQEALETYAAVHNRYPCPAIINEPLDTVDFGKEAGASGGINCDAVDEAVLPRPEGRDARKVRVGTLPVRTLELDDLGMVDAWNHRITYAITENYTLPAIAQGIMNQNEGAIGLTDSNGNDVTKQDSNAVYTLIAAGADERGAYDLQGNLIADCPDEATLAGQNCNIEDDANFRATMLRSQAQDGGGMFTNTVTFKSNGMATGWWADPNWSACTCAYETQTRAVECRDATGTQVPDDQCDTATKPDATRPCPQPACGWATGNWGACSNPCGAGTQTRLVLCRRDDNANAIFEILPSDVDVGRPFCTSPLNRPVEPASSQGCSAFGACSYRWVNLGWGACSASCGGGARYRSPQCLRSDGTIVGDAQCTSRSLPKPPTSQGCNPQSCAINGVCGSAHGGGPYANYASVPVAQRCNAGVAADRADGPSHVRWQCNGISGGATAYCQANKLLTADRYGVFDPSSCIRNNCSDLNCFDTCNGDASAEFTCGINDEISWCNDAKPDRVTATMTYCFRRQVICRR